jgi:hypothetical protein
MEIAKGTVNTLAENTVLAYLCSHADLQIVTGTGDGGPMGLAAWYAKYYALEGLSVKMICR